eukprot:6259441-Alexandrium_andersonii.AAC.1
MRRSRDAKYLLLYSLRPPHGEVPYASVAAVPGLSLLTSRDVSCTKRPAQVPMRHGEKAACSDAES